MALRVPLFHRSADGSQAAPESSAKSDRAAEPARRAKGKATTGAGSKSAAKPPAGKAASKSRSKSASTTARTVKATKTSKTSKSAKSAKSAKAAPKSGARQPAKSVAARAKAAVASPVRRKPAAASRTKPAAKSGTRARASAAARRWWTRPDDTGRTAGGGSRAGGARESGRPRVPRLQRRSMGALLARTAVITVAFVCMIAFAVALAKATLVPSPASDALIHTNLRPGASIRAYLDQPELRDAVKQIGGNILLGVPFGILLPALFPRTRGLLRVAVVTALVMVMVETAQGLIVEGRAFDIDDVILNTTGALLGYLPFGRRLGRALHPRRRHWWHTLGYGTPPPQDPPQK